ncbi:TIGR02300 family protein [Amaricoccus sp.]|uniref:TIGR02300 family protein n=1 Tax=Amaricoccus sp. TaxID=1872485 RepID=UPI001B489B16|nr:TIGR02300 family protein [Amaricoccus sp.]MBP7002261.1 TIGR02300 family protein [Amaricoccus sp.]
MPKDEWGAKRICPSCATRFYDLRHDPVSCPACGATFGVDTLSAVKAKAPRSEKAKPEPVDMDDLPDIDGDEVIADDDDLADDILEDEEDNVDLEEIADVAGEEEEG